MMIKSILLKFIAIAPVHFVFAGQADADRPIPPINQAQIDLKEALLNGFRPEIPPITPTEPTEPTTPTKPIKPTRSTKPTRRSRRTKTVTKVIDNTTMCVKYYPNPTCVSSTCTETSTVVPTTSSSSVVPTSVIPTSVVPTSVSVCPTVTKTLLPEVVCTTFYFCDLADQSEKCLEKNAKSIEEITKAAIREGGKVTINGELVVFEDDSSNNSENNNSGENSSDNNGGDDNSGSINIDIEDDENSNDAQSLAVGVSGVLGALLAGFLLL